MQTSDLAASEEALVMFRYKVRRALREQQGYECQETDGDFMLAFGSSADAVRFCLTVSFLLHVDESVIAIVKTVQSCFLDTHLLLSSCH